jgi:putative acetyltransferase
LYVPDAFTIRIVHIRHYQADDAAAMVALKRDTIRRVNRRDYSAKQVAAWAPDDRDVSQWPDRLVGRFIVVAEEAGQIIGFGDVGLDGHIDQCFVHADHQRRGVGRAVLAALLSEARRRGLPRLTSDVSITARPFFEAQGFIVEAKQTVQVKGMAFVNFRMSRQMSAADVD